MELSEVIHNKSIDSEEGKSLGNAEAAVPSEVTSGEGRCFLSLPHVPRVRTGINQQDSATLPDGLCQHPQTHFISFHISEQRTATNF